jgi:hypothetical protein
MNLNQIISHLSLYISFEDKPFSEQTFQQMPSIEMISLDMVKPPEEYDLMYWISLLCLMEDYIRLIYPNARFVNRFNTDEYSDIAKRKWTVSGWSLRR